MLKDLSSGHFDDNDEVVVFWKKINGNIEFFFDEVKNKNVRNRNIWLWFRILLKKI